MYITLPATIHSFSAFVPRSTQNACQVGKRSPANQYSMCDGVSMLQRDPRVVSAHLPIQISDKMLSPLPSAVTAPHHKGKKVFWTSDDHDLPSRSALALTTTNAQANYCFSFEKRHDSNRTRLLDDWNLLTAFDAEYRRRITRGALEYWKRVGCPQVRTLPSHECPLS